jgi:hypothetical protein
LTWKIWGNLTPKKKKEKFDFTLEKKIPKISQFLCQKWQNLARKRTTASNRLKTTWLFLVFPVASKVLPGL